MKQTRYTILEMKKLLKEFYENHPKLGDEDEWYGDQAYMTADSAAVFIVWLETGKYDGRAEYEGGNFPSPFPPHPHSINLGKRPNDE